MRTLSCLLAIALVGCAVPIEESGVRPAPYKGSSQISPTSTEVTLLGIEEDRPYSTKDLNDLTLSGRCLNSKATVEVKVGTKKMGSTTCGSDLTWKIDGMKFDSLSDGEVLLKVQQVGKTTANAKKQIRAFKFSTEINPQQTKIIGIGNTPITQLSGGTKIADLARLQEGYRDFKMSRFDFEFGRRGSDRQLFWNPLETEILPNLPADGSFQFQGWGDFGLPVGSSEMYELNNQGALIPCGTSTSTGCAGTTYKTCTSSSAKCQDKYGYPAGGANGLAALREYKWNQSLAEVKKFAGFMKKYPNLIKGATADDTLKGRMKYVYIWKTRFQKMCQEAKAIYPNFKMDMVTYCHRTPLTAEGITGEKNRYRATSEGGALTDAQINSIDWTKPTWEVEVVREYLKDPIISACVDSVQIFDMAYQTTSTGETSMGRWTEQDYRNNESCVGVLANDANHKVIAGAYTASYKSLSFEDRVHNIEQVLKLTKKPNVIGASFFQTPWVAELPADSEEDEINEKVTKYLLQRLN